VREHQVFRFGVDRGALERFSDPRGPDLEAAMRRLDAHVACAADRPAARAVDGEKRHRDAGIELGQRRIDIGAHAFGPRYRRHFRFPHGAVGRGLGERRGNGLGALPRHRRQEHVPSLERHRHNERH